MPYTEHFNESGAFNKIRRIGACPFASGVITPNYTAIRHESFHDRPLGTTRVGSSGGSYLDEGVGGESSLIEGGSHIPFATRHRGSKEAMRNPYNTFRSEPAYGSALVRPVGYGRAPDAPWKMGAPAGQFSGKERFIGRGGNPVGRLYHGPQNTGGLPIGIHYT